MGSQLDGTYPKLAAHPYYELEPYVIIDWASPKGALPPLDPSSINQYKGDPICARFIENDKAKQDGRYYHQIRGGAMGSPL
ncbi:unnamed protein product [Rotaria socialis]|nr:unnamed protein product [Rotaria socialis]CAF3343851.1 unnamed protein product [Rotaria socialis]CAF4338965.1 unnamed protein product [Rotaria socialis]CAF4534609.1 unnamed protein product [Rotaria socialis]CAF4884160.1 unnamed protein product [Rotaria socialis]